MWKGETNWPQHILTYNKPWALLSDCLYWRPVNSLRVPLSSSAPGSWDHAAQRWQYSGRFLFCVSRRLSEELWEKMPPACTAAIAQALSHNPSMKGREKKVVKSSHHVSVLSQSITTEQEPGFETEFWLWWYLNWFFIYLFPLSVKQG